MNLPIPTDRIGSPQNESPAHWPGLPTCGWIPTSYALHRADVSARVPKKKSSRVSIPSGAAIYGTVTETFSRGVREIHVHGDGGPLTSISIKRGKFETSLPGTTIVGAPPGPIHVAWDGIGYKLCSSLREIQADDSLTLIGSIEVAQPQPTVPAVVTERPPLHEIVLEQIEQLLHKVDERHWPSITEMRIKKYYPLDVPVPPQAPQQLLGNILWYASMIFGTEADQYEEFRNDGRYPAWLSRLADRTVKRVLAAVERLDGADSQALILGYHGLSKEKIEAELKSSLWEISKQYEQGTAPSQRKTEARPLEVRPLLETLAAMLTPKLPSPASSESTASQLKRLRDECDLTTEAMAQAVGIDPRNVRRHLAGATLPRRSHIAAYEKLFSEQLGKTISLKRP